ncbi:MAG: tyrosine-type recombinase/integrase [Bacteroidetes bacterium]|nr:tyrosine-type recombinase/integrase [Bacteroidota bacterium]
MASKTTVTLEPLHHRGQDCLALRFPYSKPLVDVVKQIEHIRFSKTHQCWYVPQRKDLVGEILNTLKGIAWVDYRALRNQQQESVAPPSSKKNMPSAVQAILRQMEEKLHLKGYSKSTCKTYQEQFKLFMLYYQPKPPAQLSEEEIKMYLLHLVEKKRISKSAQNQAINAIKFYYEKMLGQQKATYWLDRPIKEFKLPLVLSEEEVSRILKQVENLKHKAILYTIYSAGLRISEAINLRLTDINSDRKTVFVRNAKGGKDRGSLLSEKLLVLLRTYYKQYRPKEFLFEGQHGEEYSARSIQKILKTAVQKAGLRKRVTVHSLRHSFATHLLEHGTDLRYIQTLLGHNSSRTTEIYAHVTKKGMDKIKSPLDNLDL